METTRCGCCHARRHDSVRPCAAAFNHWDEQGLQIVCNANPAGQHHILRDVQAGCPEQRKAIIDPLQPVLLLFQIT